MEVELLESHLFDLMPDLFEEMGWESVTWFKVDDKLHSHAKVMELGDDDSDAMALWVLAGSWASDQLTDGWVPRSAARRLDAHFERRAKALVRVGLWEEDVRDGVSGWVFHGWNKPGRQPTAEQVEEKRSNKSARQQRWRENKRGEDGRFSVDADVDASTRRLVDASRDGVVDPAPTRPDPTTTSYGSSSTTYAHSRVAHANGNSPDGLFPAPPAAESAPPPDPMARFREFYDAYPRHVAPGRAERAWEKAIRGGADPAVLIEMARLFAMERKFGDKKLIPYPSSWLNDRRWEDEPDPDYTSQPTPLIADDAAPSRAVGSAIVPADPFGGDRHMARQSARYTPKPSTTDQRVAEGLRLAEYYRQRGE